MTNYRVLQWAKTYIVGLLFYTAYINGKYIDRTYIDRAAWDQKCSYGLSVMTVQTRSQRENTEEEKA